MPGGAYARASLTRQAHADPCAKGAGREPLSRMAYSGVDWLRRKVFAELGLPVGQREAGLCVCNA